MNKQELVDAIASDSKLTKADAGRALDSFVAVVIKAVKKNDKVAVAGFGSFEAAQRAARTGINPATGAKIQIKAKKAPKFKAAKAFKEALA